MRESIGMTRKKREDEKKIIVPPTGISESGKSICIVSQLHGIPEEDIRIDLEKTHLVISALIRTEKVMQKIIVPEGSRISKKKFSDGILEIIVEHPL
jgi:HSP20 family molecular chaperone IbpA